MCGIVGYIGHRDATDFLLEGLRRLEYRGYDSAGIVTAVQTGELNVAKTVGRIEKLSETLQAQPLAGTMGIGHTRWATHGAPTEPNAHPHFGGDEVLAIVHNGVIENYQSLKNHLQAEGYSFRSQTDSEVIAHLIDSQYRRYLADAAKQPPNGKQTNGKRTSGQPTDDEHRYDILVSAVQDALVQLQGTYGLVIVFRDYPDVMIAARLGSPLVVGVGDKEQFIASDASPLAGFTDKIVYLADHQLAVVTADSLRVLHRDEGHVTHSVQPLEVDATDISLNGFPHYMLKEIFEQPSSLRDSMRGRISEDDATAVFGGLNLSAQQLRQVSRICLTACGTSWHAGLVGEYLLESLARIPVEVEYASELRYRNPPLDHNTILFAITQSGETADTLAALREM
ncbi:MAG: isomerizing glutamine--fructose-6-phosphate transaminase, partial [Planctomycetales bacterium]|nr:isomerizing glutamine--fructose-6-phosphate transaminase [Planctomycetales bacterium]